MKQEITGYGIKNGEYLMCKVFYYKREAIEHAKYIVSNTPNLDWKDVLTIVRVKIIEK